MWTISRTRSRNVARAKPWNYFLASHFVRTEPLEDPARFNAEVGAMTGWSYLVIALPSTLFMFGILYIVIHGIHKHAGLGFEESLAPHLREEKAGKNGQTED